MAAPISAEIRVAALADLATGESINATAKKFGINHQTLRNWKADAGLDPVYTPSVREKIWEEVDLYLIEALQTMRVHLKVGRDEAYLKSHDTSGLAALHNSFAEKVARMVEAEETASLGVSEQPIDIRRSA